MTTVTASSVDEGWYNASGNHDSINQNTFTGLSTSQGPRQNFNSFFVFDIPSSEQLITSARFQLQVYTGAVYNLDALETLSIWDVSTPFRRCWREGPAKR